MTLEAGARLGPYEILGPLGAGGMGEVYRARDTKLGREVAIKVLPEKLSGDEASLGRFEREARAVAALSHPNILGIYDLGREGDATYAVMELLLGETLRERLGEGPLPQRKALEYALQIAHGLAAAHEKGIVHRDLKPENVFITSDGRVKILDFGLARVAPAQSEDTRSPTAVAVTEPGTVMGTVGYMSPEQVRGRLADARSDLFSFGSVLYEMLSGERAFQGDSAAETMAAIAQKDPPELAASTGRFSPGIERILRHCLEKKPAERFDTANDLAFALETAMGGPSASVVADLREHRPRWKVPAIAAAAVLAALGAGLFFGPRLFAPAVPGFQQITYHRGLVQSARFAPDGQTVVYGSTRGDEPLRLYSTRLDSIESRSLELPTADIVGMSRKGEMAILVGRRHAGTWISVGTLAKSDLAGGAPREILEDVTDADISPDGSRFAVVREMGANQRLEFPIGRKILETSGWISHPRIAPDGRRLAFLEHPAYGNDMGHVALADSEGRVTRLTEAWAGTQGLAWDPAGKEIWFTATLTDDVAARQDLRYKLYAVRPGGRPRVVYAPPLDLWLADISSSGAVLLNALANRSEIRGRLAGDTSERDLSTWSDEGAGGISDDGSIFAGIEQSVAGVGLDAFIYYRRAADRAPVRIGSGLAWALSPDGKWVAATRANDLSQIVLMPTGPGEARILPTRPVEYAGSAQRRGTFSADGRWLLFPGSERGRPPRLWLLDLDKGGPPRAVSPEGSPTGVISHDGRWFVAHEEGKGMLRCPTSAGPCSSVTGAQPNEYPMHWDAGATGVLVWDRTWPARIHRVDLETGRRDLWKEIHPPDLASVLYGNIILARDGEHYIYRFRRISSHLYLGEGLR